MATPFLDALNNYCDKNMMRLHIPGHKGVSPNKLGIQGSANIYSIDIPAIQELRIARRKAEDLAAEAWGSRRTWFITNGASQGNQTAILTLKQLGNKVLVQRNVHSSVINGLILAGMEPVFINPEVDPKLGIAHCVTIKALEASIKENPEVSSVMILSPTYYGSCADVYGLAEVAHEHDLPLVVDEAWGSHFVFSDVFPQDAISADADLVISSVHKMAGSLTQSAMLHLNHSKFITEEEVEAAFNLLESTSPSPVLMASLDVAREQMQARGNKEAHEIILKINNLNRSIGNIPGLRTLKEETSSYANLGINNFDPLKLTLDLRDFPVNGFKLNEILLDEGVFCELYDAGVIVFILGIGDNFNSIKKKLLEVLVKASKEEQNKTLVDYVAMPEWGVSKMTPREAFFSEHEKVVAREAVGRISAEIISVYPPGIPNLMPGEEITQELIDYINEILLDGGYLKGGQKTLTSISVVKQ